MTGTTFTKCRLVLHKVSCITKVFFFLFLRETFYVCGLTHFVRRSSSLTLIQLFDVQQNGILEVHSSRDQNL